jgi:glycosyltransferase involved in cell wall biosynthesis
MRILTVCTSTNVFGAEVVTLKMLEGFQRAGHAQLALTTIWTDGDFNRRLATLGIPEVRLPFGSLSKRLAPRPMWWTFNAVIRLPWLWMGWRRVIRRFNPDVVIFTTWRHALSVYPFIKGGCSFLIEYTYLTPTRTRRALYRLLSRQLTGFVAVSEFMRGHSIKIGAPVKKVHLARSAVFSASDPLRYERGDAQVLSVHDRLRIGIVGQIAPHKGHACLIDAIGLLHKEGLAVDVFVFGTGDPEYISTLKKKLRELQLEGLFHWMGYKENPAEIYRTFDVCVVPSLSGDPFPTVAMEAGAYVRPVIASRTGGLPEIVEHGVTGWLAESGSAEGLAKYMREFIKDRVIIQRMGQAGRERVFSEFSQEKMVGDLEQIFGKAKEREARAAGSNVSKAPPT